MQTETTKSGLRRLLDDARAAGKRISFVPTMGYLHEGHLTLVDHAKRHGDVVVMSIFVNPLQFGPHEDLASYPRDFARDSALAEARGVDIMYAPAPEQIYDDVRPTVTVIARETGKILEGHFRPDHFEGVLTVVAKLFNIVQPDSAIFGQKDFQQWVLVKRMVADLDFRCEVIVVPTVRESDGLAMSSRNVYLSAEDRARALLLSRGLLAARERYAAGERNPAALIGAARAVLALDPHVHVQYVELSDPRTLATPDAARDDSVMSLAAKLGTTRLIDNMALRG